MRSVPCCIVFASFIPLATVDSETMPLCIPMPQDFPMQADVHLMRWDDRSMSEAADIGVQDTYLDPPTGSDLAPMPHRFLVAENMDVEKAWQRWEATLAWRKENDTEGILSKPHPK